MTRKINDIPTTTILLFWKHMMKRHSREWDHGKPKPEGVRWHYLDHLGLVVSLTVGKDFIRTFVRGPENADAAQVRKKLEPQAKELEAALGTGLDSKKKGRFFIGNLDIDMMDESKWDAAADWLWERGQTYEAALDKHLKRRT